MALPRENVRLTRAVSISLVAFSMVSVLLFTKIVVYPAYLYSANKTEFVELATRCNIALESTMGISEQNYSATNHAEQIADQVAMVACHELNVLALQLLANGVSKHRLRFMFLKSLEDERVPLWMLSKPPAFQWEE